eukprot:9503605-Pyramimonas_sp.AAC.2
MFFRSVLRRLADTGPRAEPNLAANSAAAMRCVLIGSHARYILPPLSSFVVTIPKYRERGLWDVDTYITEDLPAAMRCVLIGSHAGYIPPPLSSSVVTIPKCRERGLWDVVATHPVASLPGWQGGGRGEGGQADSAHLNHPGVVALVSEVARQAGARGEVERQRIRRAAGHKQERAVPLIQRQREYSQSLTFYWSSTGNILSR